MFILPLLAKFAASGLMSGGGSDNASFNQGLSAAQNPIQMPPVQQDNSLAEYMKKRYNDPSNPGLIKSFTGGIGDMINNSPWTKLF